MPGFEQQNQALVWNLGHQRVRIEPWGSDSLRLRASENSEIRDDLPQALLVPRATAVHFQINDQRGEQFATALWPQR